MSLNEQEKLAKLLQKYLAGEATPEEEVFISEWYDQLHFELDSAKGPEEESEQQKRKKWLELNSRIQKADYRGIRKRQKTQIRKQSRKVFFGAALLVLILFGFGYYGYTVSNKARYSSNQSEYVKKQNNTKATQRISLSDGTLVWLEPGAQISYPKKFKGNSRDIMLSGKAFLEVARDAQHPFKVKGEAIEVQVLGTSFEVDFDPKKKEADVLVRSGKVAVSATEENLPVFLNFLGPEKEKLYLQPNESSRFNANSKTLVKQKIAPDYWAHQITRTQLIFKETPLLEVIQRIENQHKVAIRLANQKLKNCTLTAYFYDQPLEIKLEMICKSIGADLKTDNDKFIIYGEGCQM